LASDQLAETRKQPSRVLYFYLCNWLKFLFGFLEIGIWILPFDRLRVVSLSNHLVFGACNFLDRNQLLNYT